MSEGIDRIAAERKRQIEQESWSEGHDVIRHMNGELAAAAEAYTITALAQIRGEDGARERRPLCWPWESHWWKPSDDPVRNLEKAGALIAAEIDRIVMSESVGKALERFQNP